MEALSPMNSEIKLDTKLVGDITGAFFVPSYQRGYRWGETEDAIGLFTRLNIGKIPLTNAELVKAMFLSKGADKNVDKEKQEEISLQWDNIEKELHNNSLWYFLTNNSLPLC